MSDTAPTTPAPAAEAAPAAPVAETTPASILATAATEAPKVAETPAPAAAPTAPPAEAKVETKTETPAAAATPKPAPVEVAAPKGLTVDATALEGFKAVAAEVGLDSPKAQKVLDYYAGIAAAREAEARKADDARFAAQESQWLAEAKAAPDIGGQRWAESEAAVRRAVTRFEAQPVARLLHAAGLGNHPEVLRLFVRLGRAVAEDSVAGSSAPAVAAPKDPLSVLYPTMHRKES